MTWRGLLGEESTVRQKYHEAGGTRRWVSLVLIGVLVGCQAKAETGPPIRQEDAAKIKAGMTLAEIEAILGPARAATSEQTQRLDGIVATMPEPVRAAQSDKGTDRGWGNSQAWLAARVTADGHAWLVTSQFGGAPPPAPPGAPKVYFRDASKLGTQ
jgi:hypothetical protein